MNPHDIERMGSLIPYSKVKICENGSHCAMFDDQTNYFQAIHSFLDSVERNPGKNRENKRSI